MSIRLAITLSCDQCGTEVPRLFVTRKWAAAWMRQHGWEHWDRQDWCPACVMRDRLKQLADANSPAQPESMNGA